MKTIQIYDDTLTRTTPITVPDNVEVAFNQQIHIINELKKMNSELSLKIDILTKDIGIMGRTNAELSLKTDSLYSELHNEKETSSQKLDKLSKQLYDANKAKLNAERKGNVVTFICIFLGILSVVLGILAII